MSIKFLVFFGGGGILGFFWGGGGCRFYFYGRADFSDMRQHCTDKRLSRATIFGRALRRSGMSHLCDGTATNPAVRRDMGNQMRIPLFRYTSFRPA